MASQDEIERSVVRDSGTAAAPSVVFHFNAAEASRRNDLQYFETLCNRGVVKPARFSARINWMHGGRGDDDHRHSLKG